MCLIWCFLAKLCILQVFHAVSRDSIPLRKQYLEAILPPFVAVLRRWRPLLAGIYELTTSDGLNPLVLEDRALAADALPIEVAELISPSVLISFRKFCFDGNLSVDFYET